MNWLKKIAMPEYFQYLSYGFDADKGNAIVEGREPVQMSPEDVQAVRFGMIRVDTEHAMMADLSKPLLLATVAFAPGQLGVILIDGYHWATRAIQEGVGMLARVLTFKETLSCIIDPSMVAEMQKIYGSDSEEVG